MTKSVEETARLLAGEHRKEDGDMREVLWIEAPDEVRLIEVTPAITDRNEVLPFRFTADGVDVPYPSVIILLSPNDWKRVKANELALPSAFQGKQTPL